MRQSLKLPVDTQGPERTSLNAPHNRALRISRHPGAVCELAAMARVKTTERCARRSRKGEVERKFERRAKAEERKAERHPAPAPPKRLRA